MYLLIAHSVIQKTLYFTRTNGPYMYQRAMFVLLRNSNTTHNVKNAD